LKAAPCLLTVPAVKTFLAVFLGVLAAAAVVGGVVLSYQKKQAAEAEERAKAEKHLIETRYVADATLSFIREFELNIIFDPTESRVSSFANAFGKAGNIVANLPEPDRSRFIKEMNRSWSVVVQSAPKAMLKDFPPPLSPTP
jgi:K+-sensing histidine kinase KdpD